MHSIYHLLKPHIFPHSCVDDYIKHTRMTNNNNRWGTDVEIMTFANLCQTNVYVFIVQQSRWQVFPPNISLWTMDSATKSVYLLHPPSHYDVVSSI